MIINCINLKSRPDRLASFVKQAEEQKFEYRIWDGQTDLAATFRAISHAHKQIVRDAKYAGLDKVVIAEDDIIFTHADSWKYYLENMPEDFDLYMGMVYEGKIVNNKLVQDPYTFSGMTLYTISSKFYDRFLGMNDLAHIDKECGKYAGKYDYYVCPEFVCKQSNGYSDNKKKECKYDHLLKGRKLFGV